MAQGFGLVGEVEKSLAEVRRKLNLVKNHVHNLRAAAATGNLGQIPQEQIQKMLDEAAVALDEISSL
jgi:hypothetical protein